MALKAYRWLFEFLFGEFLFGEFLLGKCLFGDSRTRGLNIEDTRFTQPVNLNTRLVIITLAMAWADACATAIKGTKSIKTRAHGCRYKSWFHFGFDQFRKRILHHPETAAETWRRIWSKRNTTL